MSNKFDWEKANKPDTIGDLWRRGPSASEIKFGSRDNGGMKTIHFPSGKVDIDPTLPEQRQALRRQQHRQYGILLASLPPAERNALKRAAKKAKRAAKR